MSSARSELASLAPHLDALVTRAAQERAARVMNDVLALVHPWGFEVRLGADDRVDFGGAIAVSGAAHRRLARLGERDPALAPFAAHPAWRALQRFASCWDDPAGRLAEEVPFIGLEFDVDGEPRAVPEPSVFAMLDWPIEADAAAPGAAPAARQGQAAAQEALRTLLDGGYPAAVAARVDRCFHVLPRDARIISVAAMLGRTVPGVRVFACVPPADLERYLADLGWPGDTAAVARVVAEHARHLTSGVVQFQVDVGSQVGERLGIEFSFMRHADAAQRWHALLDQLVARGLCCAAKRAALLGWPGRSSRLGEDGARGSLVRDISHVKLALVGGVPVEAKAYLSIEAKPGA